MGSFSHTNVQLLAALRRQYAGYEFVIADVHDMIKKDRTALLVNSLFTLRDYWSDIISGRKSFRNCFYRTPYIFRRIKKMLSACLERGGYAFSFQTQSVFDASSGSLPHFVYTDHTNLANLLYPENDRSKTLYKPAWISLEKTIYDNATRTFTMSSHISRSLTEQYSCDPARVVCAYAGSNADASRPQPDGDKYQRKHILFVGVEWERKGGPQLLRAFRRVLEVHADARLTIVGCSPQVDLPNCRVVGRVPLNEVAQYYEEASIFCLPTRREPFGIVFIEALCNRLPVVASNIGAAPDFVVPGKNGYLIEPGDDAQLAEALIDLAGSPEKCRAYGEAGNMIVRTRYSWEQVAATMKKEIDSCLKGREGES